MSARQWHLPRLPREEAAARSQVAKHGAAFEIGTEAHWRIALQAGHVPGVSDAARLHVEGEWAGARYVLAMPLACCAAWVATKLGLAEIDVLPDTVFDSALEAMLSAWSESAFGGALGPVIVQRVERNASGPLTPAAALRHHYTATVRPVDSPATPAFHVIFATDTLGLMLLSGQLSRMPAARNDLSSEALPIKAAVDIGWLLLSAAQLRRVRPGDTLLLDQYHVSPEGDLWLAIDGRRGIRIRRNDEGAFIVTQSLTTTTMSFSDDDVGLNAADAFPLPSTGTDDATVALDDLPVRLTFDLGAHTLTLAQVLHLQPGEVLTSDRPIAQAVHIRANGALIGTGELVDVDGHVGVLVETLGMRNPS